MPDDPGIDKLVSQITITPDPDDPSRQIISFPWPAADALSPSEKAECDLAASISALVDSTELDDDQDPALDTPAQGVKRAWNRWEALSK
jgi:hypothetical protein